MMKKLILASIWMVVCTVQAQDVVLVGDGTRAIEPATRIPLAPKVIDTSIAMNVTKYPFLILQKETNVEVAKINPAYLKIKEKLSPLYSSYVKLGIGTTLMPLGEVFYNSKRSRKFIYGVHAKHLSSWSKIKNYAPATFDRTRVDLYGGLNERTYSIRLGGHYANNGLKYYGISDTIVNHKDSVKQRYSDGGMRFEFRGHKKDSAKVNYNVGAAYNNYKSLKPEDRNFSDWRARENYFSVFGGAWYRLKSEVYGADLEVNYNGYKYGELDTSYASPLDTGLQLNNTVIRLKPHVTTQFAKNRFRARVGLDLTFDIHNKTKVYIYPDIEVKYSMFNDIFIPYVGLRGGLKQNTYRALTQENGFLLPNIHLNNTHRAIDLYGGIKGSISKSISFNVGVSYANVKNLALFVTDTTYSLGNKFDVIYDTANVFTAEGSISYQLKEKIKVDAIARFYSYSMKNQAYAWHIPNLEIILRGKYNLLDKFIFNLDLTLENGRRAKMYALEQGITQESGQYIKKMNFIADANLSVEYRYHKRFSAFVQFNNLAAQGYQRWLNYPVQKFQVLGGVTFRF